MLLDEVLLGLRFHNTHMKKDTRYILYFNWHCKHHVSREAGTPSPARLAPGDLDYPSSFSATVKVQMVVSGTTV